MNKLLQLFIPQPSNNHRAKALHTSSLPIYITILLVFQILITAVGNFHPEVLGYASNISINDLLNDTNARRTAAGIAPLELNPQLSAAAASKGADMFANQYWSHISPSGKDPWSWIVAAGYNYIFAGENLARDFGDSRAVVDAWMNSASHKENILNSRFKDVGFAVVNGKYGDSETTIVVQEFGSRSPQSASIEAPTVAAPEKLVVKTGQKVETFASASSETNFPLPSKNVQTPQSPSEGTGILGIEPIRKESVSPPRFDFLVVTRNVSTVLLVILISVLILDGIVVYRRKIVRLSGHNYAHMMILLAVLVVLNIIERGVIL